MLRELLLRINIRRETVNLLLIILAPDLCNACRRCTFCLASSFSYRFYFNNNVFGRFKIRLDNAIALSAIVFILYEPFVFFNQGFNCLILQLFHSFCLQNYWRKRNLHIGTSFLVTSISQLSLYPILLFHFHELSLIFIFCECYLCSALFGYYFTSKHYIFTN